MALGKYEFNINWDTESSTLTDLNRRVSQITFCAVTNEFNKGDKECNPPSKGWVTALEILNSNEGVMMDMASSYGDSSLPGKIHLYSSSISTVLAAIIKRMPFPILPLITVGDIFQILASYRREKYQFSPRSERVFDVGCRLMWRILRRG